MPTKAESPFGRSMPPKLLLTSRTGRVGWHGWILKHYINNRRTIYLHAALFNTAGYRLLLFTSPEFTKFLSGCRRKRNRNWGSIVDCWLVCIRSFSVERRPPYCKAAVLGFTTSSPLHAWRVKSAQTISSRPTSSEHVVRTCLDQACTIEFHQAINHSINSHPVILNCAQFC